ncbi:PREDICTED: uncharacterized protein LOC108363377 isoform X2 [Rhagoletis zephyria]|uniref:uncharacterized protein LOC108363377 isoform X2 n=1 Tax=Rhagoletis zephyria TaxID=28612 RepID=UPI0008116940|nr:PREDICTED: uncharacterized protein LOC108363377 isoform X2 [Rhagoletis zephyria]
MEKRVGGPKKKHFRNKAAQNVRARTGTDGAPITEKKFSATEEAIYKLTNMKESVEGIVVPKFGLQAKQTELTIDSNEMDVSQILLDDLEERTNTTAVTDHFACIKEIPTQKSPKKQINSLELIGEEAEIQKDLCEKVRKIYKSIDSLYSLQKKKTFCCD